ncbi:mitogen-activated serine/threonine-protein kinase [Martiniozyma asiatica (nom. inval.)]|nr:mitogen-activated serine/threonine-protein kinase [Martiniozyma asiatica]
MSNPDLYHIFRVFNTNFVVDRRFELIRGLGQGAYGVVCSAKCTESEQGEDKVAIKKVTNIFSKKILTKRALREIKLLAHFRGHKNITFLCDLDIIPDANGNFNEIYLYEELMECDLHQIIRSKQPLTDSHHQSFIYQILCGLKYIHSADVLHRDLKPGNLLVNADCDLKICDFGLARGFSEDPEKNQGFLTEYVATRWYRAPEIILSFQGYTKAIDMWSVGCILAELLGGFTIFKGKDYVDQLNEILRVLGTPDEETLQTIKSQRAQDYVRGLPLMQKIPFESLYPRAPLAAIDLLSKILTLDPRHRITVDEALEHPYLEVWHDPLDEPVCPKPFNFDFEAVTESCDMRDLIVKEVRAFREFVRKPYTGEEEIFDSSQYMFDQSPIKSSPSTNGTDAIQTPTQPDDFVFVDQYTQQQSTQYLNQNDEIPSLLTPSDPLMFTDDMPPRPQEMVYDNANDIDLEQELAFGLDGYSYRGY